MNDRLGGQHITALLALMAVARDISNTELAEVAGIKIDGEVRRTLNEKRLVKSTRAGGNKPFVHELTDEGWARCHKELTGKRPTGSGHVGGAFYLVLAGLRRFLDREHKALAYLFQPEVEKPEKTEEKTEQPPAADLDARIVDAYRKLAPEPNALVRLADLRPLLNGASRGEIDDMLKQMSKSRRAYLTPAANRKALTDADRAAAVRIGGEDNHLLAIEKS